MSIINCETEAVSCCATECDELPVTKDDYKGFCCSIAEVPNQPAEITPVSPEILKNNIPYTIHYFHNSVIELVNYRFTVSRSFSFHSPPEKDICIFNSNFRI
ncbi:MAG: hypothetical protein ABIY50_11515 [Ignavibacteria bacterium]